MEKPIGRKFLHIHTHAHVHVHVRNRPAARKRRPTEDDLSRVRGKDSSHVRVS